MNRHEIIRHISNVGELHLHQQYAGPMLDDGTCVTRWTVVSRSQVVVLRTCGTDRCIKIPLKIARVKP